MNFAILSCLFSRDCCLDMMQLTVRSLLILPLPHPSPGYFSVSKRDTHDKAIVPTPMGITPKGRLRDGLRKEGHHGFTVPANLITRRWDVHSDLPQEAHVEDKSKDFVLDKRRTNYALGIYPQGPLCRGPGRGPGDEFDRRTKGKTELPQHR